MSDTPGSRILYHYTDNAGLVGILDKGELWFSDPRLLNDAQELKIAIEVGDFTIQECVNEHRQIWKDAGISESRFDHFVTTVRSIIRHNSHGFEVMSPPTPFIFSMTKHHDTLSQWRAYGNSQYCTGFDSTMLLARIQRGMPNTQIIDVVYVDPDMPKVDSAVSVRVDEFFKYSLNHILKHKQHEDIAISQMLFEGTHEKFFSNDRLYNSAFLAGYKHSGFDEEGEVRLATDIYLGVGGLPLGDNLFFSTIGRYPRARAKISILETPDEKDTFFPRSERLNVIKTITIGPGVEPTLAETALSVLFTRTGCNITPTRSKVPYRTDWS